MEDNNKYTDDTSSFGTSENQDTYSSPETEQPDSLIKAMPVDEQPYQQNYSAGQQTYQQKYGNTQPNYNNECLFILFNFQIFTCKPYV